MATVPPSRGPGEAGHLSDHELIRSAIQEFETETVAMQAQIAALQAQVPEIAGQVADYDFLPSTGTAGKMYFVGNSGDLFGYDATATPKPWKYLANLKGPQGLSGDQGTIVGILPSGSNPPPEALPNTLWWVANAGTTLPGPDLTPSYVGGVANEANTTTLSMAMPSFTPGDVAVMAAVVNTDVQTTSVSQTGWIDVTGAAVQSGNLHLKLWTKTLQAGDGNFTINKTGTATRMAASMMIFHNVQLIGNQPAAMAYRQVSSGTTNYAPTVTPADDSIVCGFWLEQKDASLSGAFTLTVPSDWDPGPAALTASTGAKACSAAGAYDLTVAQDAARPTGAGDDWIRSIAGTGALGLYTVALRKAT